MKREWRVVFPDWSGVPDLIFQDEDKARKCAQLRRDIDARLESREVGEWEREEE